MHRKEERVTYEIKIKLIFEQVQTLDNVLMIQQPEQQRLRRHHPTTVILHPPMLRHLGLDDKLDRDFTQLEPVTRSHDETVSTCAELVVETVELDELRVEEVVGGETVGVELCFAWNGGFGGIGVGEAWSAGNIR